MTLQKLYSYIRQAVDDYNMIEKGDRIAVGISGGKDSLTMLYGLAGLRSFYPKEFEILAITVDLGYSGFDVSEIASLCESLKVEYHVVRTQINRMVGDGQCSFCAKLRKGAFNEKAKELNCNKIAYAHNMDDVVETIMLSLIYEGRFSSFWPVTHLDKMELDLIRPLIYTPVSDIRGFKNKYYLPVTKNPCPYEKETERTYVRQLLKEINSHAPGVKKRMMTALTSGIIPEWIPESKIQEKNE